jgi:hypothetical protein
VPGTVSGLALQEVLVRNHNQKMKDMAESVLPSTARRWARVERRQTHQRDRARLRAALYEWATTIDPDDTEVDLLRDSTRAIRDMVLERRSWDKTAPLSRWALARTERDPDRRDASVPDQLEVFRRAFPDNLIGRHALSHVRQAMRWAAFARHRTVSGQSRERRAEAEHATCRADLEILLELGWHKQLNIEIRSLCDRETASSQTRPPVRWRLLLGWHDLDAFSDQAGLTPALQGLVTELAWRAQDVRRT